jgi:hypothetical protein
MENYPIWVSAFLAVIFTLTPLIRAVTGFLSEIRRGWRKSRDSAQKARGRERLLRTL